MYVGKLCLSRLPRTSTVYIMEEFLNPLYVYVHRYKVLCSCVRVYGYEARGILSTYKYSVPYAVVSRYSYEYGGSSSRWVELRKTLARLIAHSPTRTVSKNSPVYFYKVRTTVLHMYI